MTVGDLAPSFALRSAGGDLIRLEGFRGRKVVLYFYPKDDTPGCTREACSFQEAAARVAQANAVVLGVSRDEVSAHERFMTKYGLTFPLLSDPDASVCKAYGVYNRKSLYGRLCWGIDRTTFVLDERGRIARIFRRVKVDGHAQEVLEALGEAAAGTRAPSPR